MSRHEAFKRIDWQGRSIDDLHQTFHEHYVLFPFAHLTIPAVDINRSGLHRARWIDPDTEDVDLVQTHSYPPSKICHATGRCNLPGRPVLYASERSSTALYEIGPCSDPGRKELFIGRWNFRNPEVAILPILPDPSVSDRSQTVYEQWMSGFRRFMTPFSHGKIDELMFSYTCFSELYLGEHHSVTSWMSDRVLYGRPLHHMIMYPSIARKRRSACFAVRPEVVDSGLLELTRVVRLRIVDQSWTGDNSTFNLMATETMLGTPSAGRIVWEDVTDASGLLVEFPEIAKCFASSS